MYLMNIDNGMTRKCSFPLILLHVVEFQVTTLGMSPSPNYWSHNRGHNLNIWFIIEYYQSFVEIA